MCYITCPPHTRPRVPQPHARSRCRRRCSSWGCWHGAACCHPTFLDCHTTLHHSAALYTYSHVRMCPTHTHAVPKAAGAAGAGPLSAWDGFVNRLTLITSPAAMHLVPARYSPWRPRCSSWGCWRRAARCTTSTPTSRRSSRCCGRTTGTPCQRSMRVRGRFPCGQHVGVLGAQYIYLWSALINLRALEPFIW